MKNQTPKGYNVDVASERSSKGHDMLGLKELWDSLLHSEWAHLQSSHSRVY